MKKADLVNKTRNYDITVRRDGKFWYIEIPELEGATQARTLNEVEEMATDYIALATDTDPSSITLTRRIQLPSQVEKYLSVAAAKRQVEADARREAAEASRNAAKLLKENGLTMREIGAVLEVSHQRAQQLVSH